MKGSCLVLVFWMVITQLSNASPSRVGNDPQDSASAARMIDLLQSATLVGDLQAMEKLLDRCDPPVCLQFLQHHDQNGFSPIHTAAQYGQLETLKYLREVYRRYFSERGEAFFYQNTTRSKEIPAYRTLDGHLTSFSLQKKFFGSFFNEASTSTPQLFLRSPAVVWLQETPLVLAIMQNHKTVVQYLLEEFDTAKMLNASKARWLLPKAGYSRTKIEFLEDSGLVPILWATASQEMWDVTNQLTELRDNSSAIPLDKNEKSQNFLRDIVQNHSIPPELLSRIGAKLDNSVSIPVLQFQTKVERLHAAIRNNRKPAEIADIISEDPKILDANDNNGFFIAHTAAYYDRKQILSELKNRWPNLAIYQEAVSPNPFAEISKNFEGYFPLALANIRGHPDVANFILDSAFNASLNILRSLSTAEQLYSLASMLYQQSLDLESRQEASSSSTSLQTSSNPMGSTSLITRSSNLSRQNTTPNPELSSFKSENSNQALNPMAREMSAQTHVLDLIAQAKTLNSQISSSIDALKTHTIDLKSQASNLIAKDKRRNEQILHLIGDLDMHTADARLNVSRLIAIMERLYPDRISIHHLLIDRITRTPDLIAEDKRHIEQISHLVGSLSMHTAHVRSEVQNLIPNTEVLDLVDKLEQHVFTFKAQAQTLITKDERLKSRIQAQLTIDSLKHHALVFKSQVSSLIAEAAILNSQITNSTIEETIAISRASGLASQFSVLLSDLSSYHTLLTQEITNFDSEAAQIGPSVESSKQLALQKLLETTKKLQSEITKQFRLYWHTLTGRNAIVLDRHARQTAEHHMWTTLERLMKVFPENNALYAVDKLQGWNFLHTISAGGFYLSKLPKSLHDKIRPDAFLVPDRKNRIPESLEIQNLDTPLIRDLHNTIKTGNLEAITALPDNQETLTLLESHDQNGFGPLHTAAYYGQLETIKKFREKFPRLNFLEKSTTPRELKEGSLEKIYEALSELHQSMNQVSSRVGFLEASTTPTPFEEVTWDWMNETPLMIAIMQKQELTAIYLTDHYTEDSEFTKQQGFPVEPLSFKHLKWAARGHMWELMKKLMLLVAPEEIYATDSKGRNFLHMISQSHFYLFDLPEDLLIQIDPLAFEVRDNDGRIPSDFEDLGKFRDRDCDHES